MKILTGNSNRPLAEAISAKLALPLVKANVRRFSDNEIFVEILENVRGEDMFVLQSTSFPANDHLMELLITIDALRRSSARRITAVMPYYGYARQDRRTGPRTPISAKLVANLLTHAGASRVLTLDLHAAQIQGFFDIPVDNLFAGPLFGKDIKDTLANRELTVVSPDVGGVVRARAVAKRIDADLAIIDKRREQAGVSEVMNVIGDVKNRDCILIDDIVDFGRHAVQRRRRPDGPGRQVGVGLCHARRAVGRRGGPRRGLADGEDGDHRFDPADRSGARVAQRAAAQHRHADGRGDQADFGGDLGFEPVRLGVLEIRRWAPLEATPRVRERNSKP